jgi:hypothetical protein
VAALLEKDTHHSTDDDRREKVQRKK